MEYRQGICQNERGMVWLGFIKVCLYPPLLGSLSHDFLASDYALLVTSDRGPQNQSRLPIKLWPRTSNTPMQRPDGNNVTKKYRLYCM